jgi:putative transposase
MSREQEAGAKTADVCHKIPDQQRHLGKWKTIYGGLEGSDAKRQKALDNESSVKKPD